ncbi:phosphoribosylformylglycinamidine synthase [Bacillus thermophilus]|uniref:Phosphoribosylformylglycinamidine synthase subunit PurS n=1 Tax=Siminovitchia thermophila TaxID=1245522 RepID=A0ABS2RBK6_9BACI|nr:phosphoribosylformylglycinamidine synthase subunit PurS [Siminovitchia thermophila]MBM7717041.1 phosphoribosylformylglycinamidine synthase [Siminovitchia thermophila]ONK24580.1 phosphoribosylformylglycinamidine synthase subunit PurS [Bacillus sp. VT-16-64]
MYKVKIFVTLRESVIDPAGDAAMKELKRSEFPEVESLRIGKYIEVTMAKTDKNVEEAVQDMCRNLLVNTEVEDYRFEIEEVVAE